MPFFLFLGFLLAPALFAVDDYTVGEVYKVPIVDFIPTQYAVSKKEVAVRLEHLQEKDDDGDITKYKLKKTGTAVIGPGGDLYLIDGHHFAYALLKYGHNKMYVEIQADLSDLSKDEFWKKMKAKKWVYPKDNEGNTITVDKLPKKISALKDDPYRGIAWMVKKCGGFTPLDLPFQEFKWAEFFREHFTISANASNDVWEATVRKALKLATSDEASHLPGWHGHQVKCADIFAALGED